MEEIPGELSQSILESQLEAEKETEALRQKEEWENESDNENQLPEIPRLLQLPQQDLINKTQDLLKNKKENLDLLLLKAESYSHFIAENQKRTKELMDKQLAKRVASNVPTKSNAKANKISKDSSPSTASLCDTSEHTDIQFQQPKSLSGGMLLPYQLEGLQWLLSLWENGLSGILADEMGLGKTIQVIALIAHLRDHNTPGPYLIAAPLATLPNWINEFKKWLPNGPLVLYHGSKEERMNIRKEKMPISTSKTLSFPIVVTSFEILMIDRHYLEKYVWQYLILDEGHRIKNRNCKLVRELKSIKSISRLLLSGTPIQNTLDELWSLLNFCSPMIFDDIQVFRRWFDFKNIGQDTKVDDILGEEQSKRIVTKLHEILRPFLLRRMKADISIKIPPKREIVVYCPKTALQLEYYQHAVLGTLRDALIALKLEHASEISQINLSMTLRKICNHPFLFGEPRDPKTNEYMDAKTLANASGKLKLVDRMLPRLKNGNHKVLIFSQMTKLLDILEDYLLEKEFKYCRLDGSNKVEERQQSIDDFNKDSEIFVFLLSTRAGGQGINLAAADTVILFDSDWNPHQDAQAQDRCHRIGQQRPVVTYRLITTNSVDIEMLEKQVSKKKLERLAIQGGDFRHGAMKSNFANRSKLTLARIRELLSDDVKNLQRMSSSELDEHPEISDKELDLIMNRPQLFDLVNNIVSPLVPLEGDMFDIVTATESNILQNLN